MLSILDKYQLLFFGIYVLAAVFTRLSPRVSIVIALALLVVMALSTFISALEGQLGRLGFYTFYFLSAGVIQALVQKARQKGTP